LEVIILKSKTPPDIFEASHGTADISNKDWRTIRSMLRILFNQSENASERKVREAIKNITRDDDRNVFINYFLRRQSIVKIAMNEYYSIDSVKRYLKRGTKEFIIAYCDGALLKPFIE